MSDSYSSSAVYTICVNNKLYRRTLQNRYALISSIETEIRREFAIPYDFELTYKGAILSSDSSFIDQRINSGNALQIRPKSHHREAGNSASIQATSLNLTTRTGSTSAAIQASMSTEIQNSAIMYNVWTDEYRRSISTMNNTIGYESLQSKKLINNIHAEDESLATDNLITRAAHHFSTTTSPINTDDLGQSTNGTIVNTKTMTPHTTSIATIESDVQHRAKQAPTGQLLNESSVLLRGKQNFEDLDTAFKQDYKSDRQSFTVKVASLDKIYRQLIPPTKSLRVLWQSIDDSRRHDRTYAQSKKICPLLFNNRMHIFSDIRDEEEALESFLQFRSSSRDELDPQFFIYFLQQTELEYMYTYQKEPREIFAHSYWWTPQVFPVTQDPLAKGMLLTSLYALRRYFRQPLKDEVHRRQKLEIKFLIVIQRYIFLPAVMSLVHALQGRIFLFEKPILYDALLQLLSDFCPPDTEQSMLGAFMPNLICWLLEQCANINDEILPCITYDLSRCIKGEENCHIDEPTVKGGADEDSCILCDQVVMDERKITSHADLYCFVKHWKNVSRLVGSHYDTKSYTVVKQVHAPSLERMKSLTHAQLTETFDTIVLKYPVFKLTTRKDIHNSTQDQIVLLKDRQICLTMCQGQRREIARVSKIIYIFDPMKSKDRITYKDLYDIQRDGPNIDPLPLLIQSWLRICRFQLNPHPVPTRPVDQITLVLVDVSESMFYSCSEKNDQAMFTSSLRLMLNVLSQNLDSTLYEHAFGLIQFGSQIRIMCPITQDVDKFEQIVANLNYRRQNSTRLYDAIQTGIECLLKYQQQNCDPIHKPDKLIICITNGVNNRGNTNFKNLRYLAKKSRIRIDLISFLTDSRLLKASQERIELQNMKRLCEETKGFIYQTKCLSFTELVNIFKQEACLWIRERASNGSFTGKYPMKRQEMTDNVH